jgi:methyl-accepting chemotaxis protein
LTLPLVALASAAALLPLAARAQVPPVAPKIGGEVPVESLAPQQKEMLALGQEFGQKATAILERWIASKEVSEERLFARLYYPVPNTDPPKFTTDYDRLADRDIQPLGEAYLARSPALVFINVYDLNDYNPTHNLKFAAQPTGNRAFDLMNSRQKWLTQNHTGLLSSHNKAPFLIQTYQRDTGEVLEELAVPIIVHGQQWGAVRLAYRQQAVKPAAPEPKAEAAVPAATAAKKN